MTRLLSLDLSVPFYDPGVAGGGGVRVENDQGDAAARPTSSPVRVAAAATGGRTTDADNGSVVTPQSSSSSEPGLRGPFADLTMAVCGWGTELRTGRRARKLRRSRVPYWQGRERSSC